MSLVVLSALGLNHRHQHQHQHHWNRIERMSLDNNLLTKSLSVY